MCSGLKKGAKIASSECPLNSPLPSPVLATPMSSGFGRRIPTRLLRKPRKIVSKLSRQDSLQILNRFKPMNPVVGMSRCNVVDEMKYAGIIDDMPKSPIWMPLGSVGKRVAAIPKGVECHWPHIAHLAPHQSVEGREAHPECS